MSKGIQIVVGLLLRHLMTAAGVTGLYSNEEITQAVSGVAIVAGILWSAIPKLKAART